MALAGLDLLGAVKANVPFRLHRGRLHGNHRATLDLGRLRSQADPAQALRHRLGRDVELLRDLRVSLPVPAHRQKGQVVFFSPCHAA